MDCGVASQHPEMWTWTYPRGKSPEHFQTWFQSTLEAGEECAFATLDRATGRPIGSTGYHALRPEHRGLEIGGTWLEPSTWGTGANIEAKLLMLAHAFERLGCEFAVADMRALPFSDGEADLVSCYSGLHMLKDPEPAVRELARCLKPGGELVGTTFLAEASRRQQALFELERRRGNLTPPHRDDLRHWLHAAEIADVVIEPERGLRCSVDASGQSDAEKSVPQHRAPGLLAVSRGREQLVPEVPGRCQQSDAQHRREDVYRELDRTAVAFGVDAVLYVVEHVHRA